jgi:hypothetical protein
LDLCRKQVSERRENGAHACLCASPLPEFETEASRSWIGDAEPWHVAEDDERDIE